MSSSVSNDPRQPSAARPFVAPMIAPQDLPIDYSGFIAVICAVVGVMFRVMCLILGYGNAIWYELKGSFSMYIIILSRVLNYKLGSWLAIIFCAQSLANMKNMENDLKQISMAMMFAIMGLITNYFGPARPATQS